MAGELKWYGERVKKHVATACRIGINRTMGEGVALAKDDHPFTNRTGLAERSIQIVQQAVSSALETFGLWGSKGCNYFRHLELGTKTQTQSFASLAPAARVVYKNLTRNIQAAYAGMGKK